MTKVMGAGAAEALIYELRQRLPSSGDAVVLLVNAALAEDRDRNRIASEALAASARKALVLVRLDEAEAPIGLRDMPAFPWTPGSPFEREQISAITAAVSAIEPDMLSRPAPPAAPPAPTAAQGGLSRRTLIAGGAGAVVLALVAVLSLHSGPPRTASYKPPPPSFPVTAGAEAPNSSAGAEAPNAAAPNTDLNATAGASNPSSAAPAEPTPDSQQTTPAPRGQMGMAAFAVAAIILLLASLAVQVLGLLTQINGPRWLREQTDKLWTRLATRRTPKVVAVPAAQALTESKSPIVFASYSRKDREAVDPLIVDFETQGVPVWLDRVDIAGGVIWPEAIVQAIRGARAVVVFCSPNAFNSDNVLREINLAASYGKTLLPIVLTPGDIPDSFLYYLATSQFVDLSSETDWRSKVFDRLKAAA